MSRQSASRSVFINCPFDPEYQPIFRAVLFTVCALEFKPRSALEVEDASDLRLQKIYQLIGECPFAIHDLSRTELSKDTKLPRFNMPLELGIFLGAKQFGRPSYRKKRSVIFAKNQNVKSFISDINGMDIKGHGDQPSAVIAPIRHGLVTDAGARRLPGSAIEGHFSRFEDQLPSIMNRLGYRSGEAQYGDLLYFVAEWLENNPVELRTN